MLSTRFLLLKSAVATSAIAALQMGMPVMAGAVPGASVKTTTLVFYPGEPQIGPTTIDIGPAGEIQGDMTVVTRPVLRQPGGAVIGRTDVHCVKTDVTQPGHPF
jgi:RNA 3'-terminal phosphate cyclase